MKAFAKRKNKKGKAMDDKLYEEAMKRMDLLVEEVIAICDEVADENDYEKEWVLEIFREKFNKAKINIGK